MRSAEPGQQWDTVRLNRDGYALPSSKLLVEHGPNVHGDKVPAPQNGETNPEEIGILSRSWCESVRNCAPVELGKLLYTPHYLGAL